jgi:hypothetical protein
METVEDLRELIGQFRERLTRSDSAVMVMFILDSIEEAERNLAETERED